VVQAGARFGASLAVDEATGLALIGAPNAFTSRGFTGAVMRFWMIREALQPPNASTTSLTNNGSAPSAVLSTGGSASAAAVHVSLSSSSPSPQPPPAAPSPPPTVPGSLALHSLHDRFMWAHDAEAGDAFGVALAFGEGGHSIVGANAHSVTDANGTRLASSGAVYVYDPTVSSPSAPPHAPPPPWRPDALRPPSSPDPAYMPRAPPTPSRPEELPILEISIAGGGVLLVLLLLGVLWLLRRYYPRTYRKCPRFTQCPPSHCIQCPVPTDGVALLALQVRSRHGCGRSCVSSPTTAT
jgi:hypothetical protein